MSVEQPVLGTDDLPYISALDAALVANGSQDVERVANTIFPLGLARTSGTRPQLYRRYLALHDGLRRASKKNLKGLYFERLIRYPLQIQIERTNQLETIVSALQGARLPGGLHHAYELQIFCPGKDVRPRGFPCLSSISLHVEGDALRLAATYRNQWYIRKALGNFVGLANLQNWIAAQAGLGVGTLSIHAFHAEVDPDFGVHRVGDLMSAVRQAQTG